MAGYFIGHGLTGTGNPGDIDTVQRNPLGARVMYQHATYGLQEYVYLLGVASTLIDDAVTYSLATYATARLIADAVGLVAVASAAIVASNWGWYLVKGLGLVNSDTVAAAGGLFIDGTTGRVDDASVAGDMIYGMIATAADVSNKLTAHLNYPMVTNTVPA